MIDIKALIKAVKFDIYHFDRIKDTDARKMLKALEQQQDRILILESGEREHKNIIRLLKLKLNKPPEGEQ